MKKLFRVIIIFFLLPFTSFSQLQIEWQQCYGGSNDDYARSIIQDGNGYKIIGYTTSNDGDISYNHGSGDYWLIKIDSIGNLLWEKTYGGSLGEYVATGFYSNGSNDVFLVGASSSSDYDISYNPYPDAVVNFWIVKTDSIGSIIWDRIVGNNVGNAYGMSGASTSDGGVVVTGNITSNGGDITNYYGGYDVWVIKLDGSGDTEWDFTLGSTTSEFVNAITQTSDDGYLIGAYGTPQGGGNIDCITQSTSNPDAILFKIDNNGNEQWQQCYGGSGHDGIVGLLETEDGYLISSFGGSDDGDLEGSGWHGESDIWLIKTDFEGSIIWQKCYGGSESEYAETLFNTADGGFIVFGTTYSFNGDIVGNQSYPGNPIIWVFKISSIGELLWQQCIGGFADEQINLGVIQKSDYNYVVAGEMTNSPSGDVDCGNISGEGSNYWVFELSDTTVNIVDKTKIDVIVYPNPANTVLNIGFPDVYNSHNTTVEIVDVNGKTILILERVSGSTQLDIKRINRGFYILKIQNDRTILTKKIIIQ